MSRYFYSALGHCVRCLDGSFICARFQRGRWIVIENGCQFEAEDYV